MEGMKSPDEMATPGDRDSLTTSKSKQDTTTMTKKQAEALAVLRRTIQEKYGDEPVSIEDVISVARKELKYGIPRIAALFELNKGDIHRFLDNGLVPPYVEQAFRRYFTLNKVYNYEYEY